MPESAPLLTPAAPPASPTWHAGMRLTILVDATTTDGRLALCELVAPRGRGFPWHCHTKEDETIVVREGALTVWRQNLPPVTLRAGDALSLPRGVPHRVEGASTPDARYLLALTPGGLEQVLAATSTDASDAAPDPDDVAALMAAAGVTLLGWAA